MKQKFLPKETAVPSEGNFAHLSGSYRPACKLFALITALLLLGANWNGVWGQVGEPDDNYHPEWDFCYDRPEATIVNKADPRGLSETIDTIYVMPGRSVDITLQYAPTGENLNGYVRWFVENQNGVSLNNLQRPTSRNHNLSSESFWPEEGLVKYKNGYAWFRYAKNDYQEEVQTPHGSNDKWLSNIKGNEGGDITIGQIGGLNCYITYNCPQYYDNSNPDIVVCEASSLIDFDEPLTGETNVGTREAPTLSVRRKYVIQTATERQTQLETYRNNINRSQSTSSWLTDIRASLPTELRDNSSNYFKEVYSIHTPIYEDGTGTNYRLGEIMDNYFVPGSEYPANQVRWRWYEEDGTYLSFMTKTQPTGHPAITDFSKTEKAPNGVANILRQKFTLSDRTKTSVRYLTAEVGRNGGTWYPVAFYKISLEPYIVPLTQEDLKKEATSNFAYERRLPTYLANPARFEEIEIIDFDNNEVKPYNEVSAENNVAASPFNADTYYAFAYPSRWQDRANKSRTTGRGEYGLYRTLNVNGISNSDQHYVDYYMYAGYNHWLADKTYEDSQGQNSGYFLYVDAADEPGTIAEIELTETLCPSTSLIVTAWVCNLQHTKVGEDDGQTGVSPADIGIIFKGISKDENGKEVETVIDRYYSGELPRKHEGNDNPKIATQAYWQQIYFNFTTDVQYERYKVVLTNNSRNSNAADYAIDNIQVLRSLPAIEVSRLDACDASHLYVNSDFQTILNNMGWDLDEDVLDATNANVQDFNTRKYRYGFLDGTIIQNYRKVGNVYFGVLEGDKFDAGEVEWVTINKSIEDNSNEDIARLSKVIRSVVPTNLNQSTFPRFPKTEREALALEIEANIEAMKDYNADVDNHENITNFPENVQKVDLTAVGLENVKGTDVLANASLLSSYEEKIKEFYTQLAIPRIHVPWASAEDQADGIIYLASINVENTDMKYIDEQDENGNVASGYYKVILFSANQIVHEVTPDPKASCALISDFHVFPSIVIKVDTKSETGDVACLGEVYEVTAQLVQPELDENGYETGEIIEVTDVAYNFDWYLGSYSSYIDIMADDGSDLKDIIYELRTNSTYPDIQNGSEAITVEVVNTSSLSPDKKKILLGLLDAPSKLRTGKDIHFQLVNEIVAMPYVDNAQAEETRRLYCTEIQTVPLVANANVPELAPGFPGVDYTSVHLTNVPLRIGLIHIKNTMQLTNIPIQKSVKLGVEGAFNNVLMELAGNNNILLEIDGQYQSVATLNNLLAQSEGSGNNMTFTFKQGVSQYFEEGKEYDLLIPFGEYESETANNPIKGSCEGYATLVIKIVPEYLTWKGTESAHLWYVDGNWERSTKGDLYFDGYESNPTADANNGTNPLTEAYSPLYFTKITIPAIPTDNTEGLTELALAQKTNTETLSLGDGYTIQYDMAVNTDANGQLKVTPYYISKVEQIYFKPEASIYRQDYLDYKKAWVDFEMKANTPYWMSAPLQNVYAGDMYAPSNNGRQETAAFTDITYKGKHENGTTNSRWKPAFYQKAWDKAISYITKEGYTHNADNATDVAAVKSNWSIEYNDVWVPYSEGKGFYARVENLPGNSTSALVRLPKADTKYSYETKAANNLSKGENISRANAYKLWGDTEEATKGNVTVDLSKVDGDNQYFLVGNPYMAYLDMDAFFKRNSVLAKKYWLLENGTSKAVVGTPDVDWKGNETEDATNGGTIDGLIPPMTAFFVELANTSTATQADNTGAETSISITFTPDMMAKRPQSTAETKAASFAATNPTLTITAECGETRSVAKLVTSDKAENGYRASEDAVVLLDSELDAPMVYTVAGSRAAQVNAMKEISNVGLGVYNENDDEATVTISGLSQMASPLYLYDARTRKSVELSGDSYTMQITGDSHGRYYLRNSAMADELENTISIYSAQRGQVIVSALQPVREIKVFNVSGALVRQFSVNTTQYTFPIQSGLYIIYASDGEQEHTEKVIVR